MKMQTHHRDQLLVATDLLLLESLVALLLEALVALRLAARV